MRSFFACLLAWFLASLGGCLASQKRPTFQGPKSVQVLYSGDVRGEVEPCGCVTGQKGGIPRRAGFIRQALQKNPPRWFSIRETRSTVRMFKALSWARSSRRRRGLSLKQ